MRSSFIKVTTTNAVREENERERKERRESEREKERKERLFCDVKRFSAALLLFSVKEYFVWCWGKGHVTNILIKTRARTLFSTALKRARKRTEKAAQRENTSTTTLVFHRSLLRVRRKHRSCFIIFILSNQGGGKGGSGNYEEY